MEVYDHRFNIDQIDNQNKKRLVKTMSYKAFCTRGRTRTGTPKISDYSEGADDLLQI